MQECTSCTTAGRSCAHPPSEQRPGECLHPMCAWAGYPGAAAEAGTLQSLSLKSSWGSANAPQASSPLLKCCSPAWGVGAWDLDPIPQGRVGFWIPNPTGYSERDYSKTCLEEVISWRAVSFNVLKLHLPFTIGLGCLCCICVTDRKVSCWKPIYCKDLSSSLLGANLILEVLR